MKRFLVTIRNEQLTTQPQTNIRCHTQPLIVATTIKSSRFESFATLWNTSKHIRITMSWMSMYVFIYSWQLIELDSTWRLRSHFLSFAVSLLLDQQSIHVYVCSCSANGLMAHPRFSPWPKVAMTQNVAGNSLLTQRVHDCISFISHHFSHILKPRETMPVAHTLISTALTTWLRHKALLTPISSHPSRLHPNSALLVLWGQHHE